MNQEIRESFRRRYVRSLVDTIQVLQQELDKMSEDPHAEIGMGITSQLNNLILAHTRHDAASQLEFD